MIEHPLTVVLGRGVYWDNHACMPLSPIDLGIMSELSRVRAAGVNVISVNVAFGRHTLAAALDALAAFRAWLKERPTTYLVVRDLADVDAAVESGRLAVSFDVESMNVLDGDIGNVGRLYDLGVRWMLATYNATNAAGGGCLGDDSGLTAYGRSVIAEMNRTGMVVCASHCGYRTAHEMIDASESPVIFSHSNPRSVWDHPRNLPDDLMVSCAERGGVIGINGFGPFLGDNVASTTLLVEHIEYALDLVGDEHVGIGLDYVFDRKELDLIVATDPETFPPTLYGKGANMVEPWRLPEVAVAMLGRGHSVQTLAKLFGGNHYRIASRVWR